MGGAQLMNGNLINLSKAQFDFKPSNCSYSSEPADQAHVRHLVLTLKQLESAADWDCFDRIPFPCGGDQIVSGLALHYMQFLKKSLHGA